MTMDRRHMGRRTLLGTALTLPLSSPVLAQPSRRLAIVSPGEPLAIMSETGGNAYYRVLFEDLRALGHVEGRTLIVDRYGRERAIEVGIDRMIAEAVAARPDVIYAIGGAGLVKAVTRTIPIVALTGDPVALGLAQSVARPGGNVTGVSVDTGPSLYGKRIELLREVKPGVARIGYVTTQRVWEILQGKPMRAAAEAAGVSLLPSLVGMPAAAADYADAVRRAAAGGADALMIGDGPEALQYRDAIVEAVAATRLPAIYTFPESTAAGGLIAYSFDLKDLNRQVAKDIDAILKGASPAGIPFYQVARLILSVNLKTARGFGLELPPTLVARADDVID